MKILRPVSSILLLLLVLFSPNVKAQTSKPPKTITVTGTLVRVSGIGGETTGWAINLDSEINIRGERVKMLEVSGNTRAFDKLENKRVEATGKLGERHGVMRGEWSVLEVSRIRELPGKR